jgi:hypothetical protein
MDTKLRNLDLATVPGKKDDPNYAVVRGHVPIDLYKRFKFFCVEKGVDNSEGLEVVLRGYFEWQDTQQNEPPASSTSAKGTGGKGRGKKRSEDE